MHITIEQKGELEGALYVVPESKPKISLKEVLKNAQKCEKKMHFMLQLMISVQSRSTLEGALDSVPKHALSDLHKDAQESSCKVALKRALEVAREMHCWW